MTQTFIAVAIVVSCLSSLAFGQGNQAAEPDPAEVIRTGLASLKRLEASPASWTTSSKTNSDADFVVEVIATPTARRVVFSIETQGRRHETARLFQTEDAWYVVQGGTAAKYRPFEVPFDVPATYMFLLRSNPQFAAVAEPGGFGTFEGIEGDIATYRNPLPDSARLLLENSLSQMEQLKRQNPELFKADGLKKLNQAKELLANGLSTQIDLKTGMFVEFGSVERRTKVTRFRWLEQVDSKDLDTKGRKWDDFTSDPTLGDRHELLMLSHSRIWRPEMVSADTDGRLVELGSNRFRRIPFEKDIVMRGCFNKDRTRVIVSGFDGMSGVIGLYEIDLKTTENRQLGGDALSAGFSLFPALSPDGKTVAVLHTAMNAPALQVQIYLVDLESGVATKLGAPRDTGPISWFPDGRGLLLVERDSKDLSKPSIETVCRIDLNGQVTRLCPGSSPVFLENGANILFEDQSSNSWKTCNLQGGEIQEYANGLKGYGFPAPSPNGKRLLMMQFQKGKAPTPMIFEVGSSEGKKLELPPGLWTGPAWR